MKRETKRALKRVWYGTIVILGASFVIYDEAPLWFLGSVLVFVGMTGYYQNKTIK